MSDDTSEKALLNLVEVAGSMKVKDTEAQADYTLELTPITMPGVSPMSSRASSADSGAPRHDPLLGRPQSGQSQNSQYQNPYQQGAPPQNPYQQGPPQQNPYQHGPPPQNPYQKGPHQQNPDQQGPPQQQGGPNPYQQGPPGQSGVPANPYQQGAPQPQPVLTGGYQPQQQELVHRGPQAGPSGAPEQPNQDEDTFDDTNSQRQFGPLGWAILTICVLLTFPFSLLCFVKVLLVKDYERVVIQRLGRMLGAKGPGIVVVFPCIEEYSVIGLRTIAMDVPPQVILTKDSVSVNVDAVVYYHVINARKCVQNIENARYSTSLVAQTTLRNLLGTRSMAGILAEREEISKEMLAELDVATDHWGIRVERVEVKDVRIPYDLQRAMAAEAEATREAKAKLIHAEAEQLSSVKLKEAADVIAQCPTAVQLRFLQTMTSMSVNKNTTILFPLPIDILPPGLLQKKRM